MMFATAMKARHLIALLLEATAGAFFSSIRARRTAADLSRRTPCCDTYQRCPDARETFRIIAGAGPGLGHKTQDCSARPC